MVIFRIIRNLIRLAFNLLWLPFNLIGRNAFGLILLVSAIAFFVILNNDSSNESKKITVAADVVQSGTTKIEPPAPPVRNKKAPPLIIEPVHKVEDGNSSFAQDLIKLMTDGERAYYSQIFYWVMNNASAGKPTNWENVNTHGSITPQAIFLNSKGRACRKFTETLKVKTIKQNIRGLACQRGGGAWCKLAPNSTPSCGLGQEPSFLRNLGRSIGF